MAISRNIKSMSDDIQHLKDEVHNLDVEIPAHTSGDAGKYLGVDSSGNLAFSKVPDELPPTTSATAGQILALDSNKAPEWVNNYNLNYSETEINTGKKWVDGKDIYSISINYVFPIIENMGNIQISTISTGLNIIKVDKILSNSSGTSITSDYLSLMYNNVSGSVTIIAVPNSLSEGKAIAIIYYTKPTPSALTSGDPNRSEPETREADPEIIEEPEQVEEPVVKKTTRKSTK